MSGQLTKYSRRQSSRHVYRQRRNNGYATSATNFQETSVNLVSYNMVCREVLRQHNLQRPQYFGKETSDRMHQEIVKAAYAKFGLEFNETAYNTGSRFEDVKEENPLEKRAENGTRRNSVLSSDSASSSDSEEPASALDKRSVTSTPFFNSSSSASVSGSTSPMPSDSFSSTSTSSYSPRGFAFLPGVVNAPVAARKTVKICFDDGSFEILETSESPIPSKKTRVFTPEELQKQSTLVEEMKRNIQECLHQ